VLVVTRRDYTIVELEIISLLCSYLLSLEQLYSVRVSELCFECFRLSKYNHCNLVLLVIHNITPDPVTVFSLISNNWYQNLVKEKVHVIRSGLGV